MNNREMIDKYSITKRTGISVLLQMILITAALIISLFGIFKSLDLANSLHRVIVYGGQAALCLATIVFGLHYFSSGNTKYFRRLIIGYALLEAVRVSLLQTGGISGIYSAMAKFILALLVLDAALLSERIEKKEGLYLALAMAGLEIALYVIFLVGFPAVRTRLLYMILPLVGILMAGSVCSFIAGRRAQTTCGGKEASREREE